MSDDVKASAAYLPDTERDPYACQVCNCHHHTTAQHDARWWADSATDADWDDVMGE